jgi:uncharacterized NAD(P)/FAD-binding protein YdhS
LRARRIAVIGGGCSGTLLALHLAERGLAVTLIERADRLARGIAYSTPHPDHLLNVPAARMSAFPDRPDHFARWAEAEGAGEAASFVARRDFGRYLEQLLATARLNVVRAEAIDIAPGKWVRLADGREIEADAVVLALGNLPPETPRLVAEAGLADGVYVGDPWSEHLAAGLDPDHNVLLLGTGLTAVDAALTLDSAGFRGRILALSRRGLLPRAHADAPHQGEPPTTPPEPRCASLLPMVRADAERIGWRAAVESLRPVTQALWAGASIAERRRFLRHLRPWWDVHRHRVAPVVALRIDQMVSEERLQIAAGRIASIEAMPGAAARIIWRPRGGAAEQSLLVHRIVNCTGPQTDIARASEPLLDALLGAGHIRPDPCRIGVDVDACSRVLDAEGRASDALYAVGPVTRGAFWEIVAVPDIRHQVKAVAERLT